MDRDVAQKILEKITSIKTTLQTMVINSVPVAPESKSVSQDNEEQQRSVPDAALEETEAPEESPEEEPEPVTKEKK